jgi:hypothetical protein
MGHERNISEMPLAYNKKNEDSIEHDIPFQAIYSVRKSSELNVQKRIQHV